MEKNIFKIKLFSLFFLVILIPSILFSQPKKASAQFGYPVQDYATEINTGATATASSTDSGTNIANTGLHIKDFAKALLAQVIITIEHNLLNRITQSMVNWINSGFHGSPLFVQNPTQFFGDIAKTEVKSLITETGYNTATFPFGKSYDLQVINMYKTAANNDMVYSLSQVTSDPVLLQRYQNTFNAGGWNAFYLNTQYPQNNYPGYAMIASQTLASKLASTNQVQNLGQKANDFLTKGSGFLSPTMCPTSINPSYNTMTNEFNPPVFDDNTPWDPPSTAACLTALNPDQIALCAQEQTDYNAYVAKYQSQYDANEAAFNKTNGCVDPVTGKSALVATTPGAVVSNQITSALNIKTGSAELDASLGNAISVILNAFINHFLDAGLSGIASLVQKEPSPDNWTYLGQNLGDSGGSTSNNLIVPSSVVVKPGETSAAATISGGTPPYSIQTPPDLSIATANVSGSSLTVKGISTGETFFVVQDSKGQTAPVQVTVSLVIDFNNPTLLQTINVDAQGSTTVSIINGTAPYSISAQPDSSIAEAILSESTLGIVGVSAGKTNISLQDSGGKKVVIQIVVGNATPFSVDPTSVSVAVGKSTTVSISGGTTPFSIQSQPDANTAQAFVLGNTMTVVGVSAGSTSVIIQDSFSPANTATIPINVTASSSPGGGSSIDFNNPTAQNISLYVGSSTQLSMSGGTTPYTISTPSSDTSVATATLDSSGTSITVNGIAEGNATFVVQDTTTPTPNSVTVRVTVSKNTNTDIPANAVATTYIENHSNWVVVPDEGTGPDRGVSKGSHYASNIVWAPVSNPAPPTETGGRAQQFSFDFLSGKGVRASDDFATDTSYNNFVYDTWIYFPNPLKVAQMELDMNKIDSQGNFTILGIQCDTNKKSWDVTYVSGGSHWRASNLYCDPHDTKMWSANTWHHVQLASHVDTSNGNAVYDWVNFDGVKSTFVGQSFASKEYPTKKWAPNKDLINFQAEGGGGDGSVLIYGNDITVWRW